MTWRYALLSMSVLILKNNLWTMCEVRHAICCQIKDYKYGSQDDTFRFSGWLAFRFEGVVVQWGATYDGFTDELCAWVDLLAKPSRGAHDQVGAAERFRSELALMAERGIKVLSLDVVDRCALDDIAESQPGRTVLCCAVPDTIRRVMSRRGLLSVVSCWDCER